VTIPVSDVDRDKAFYVEQTDFVADHDHVVAEGLRFVQPTPPGSACSIAIGTGLTESEPGSAQLQLVVADIHAAQAELFARGLERRRGANVRLGLVRVLRRPGREPLGRPAAASTRVSRTSPTPSFSSRHRMMEQLWTERAQFHGRPYLIPEGQDCGRPRSSVICSVG
jgi:catechol 2,3-dioxygenase-like lactoylglutathione lyase family enzyme